MIDSLILENLSDVDTHLVDSRLKVYHRATNDTSKINAINIIVEKSWDLNLWPKYNIWVHDFVKSKIESQPPTQALRSFNIALAASLGNIGYLYDSKGHYHNLLKYYHKSLKLKKEIDHKYGIAVSLNCLGILYNIQKDDSSALKV